MSFQDIRGQDRAVDILKGYIRSDTVAGTYLFSGAEGVGKGLAARTFAKVVNCLDNAQDSCDTCVSCAKIDKNQHPDIHWIDLEDNDSIKIEYIRNLKRQISLRPFEAKKKVFIINDAHNLTAEASGALLKITEEPPNDTLIILITAKPKVIFDTIISRSKKVNFYPFSREGLAGILAQDYSVDSITAHFLAYFSEGRLGLALKLKDADILGEKNRIIDGLAFPGAKVFADSAKLEKPDLVRSMNLLVTWFRDIYLLKLAFTCDELINLDRKDELLKLSARYSFTELEGIMESISRSLVYLEQNVNAKLLLSNLRVELWKG